MEIGLLWALFPTFMPLFWKPTFKSGYSSTLTQLYEDARQVPRDVSSNNISRLLAEQ